MGNQHLSLSLSPDQIQPNQIARLLVVIVVVVLTTPQTKDIHTNNSYRQLTPLLWKNNSRLKVSHPYASSSFDKIKNNSQEAYLDTGLYTGRPCSRISRHLTSLFLIKIIIIMIHYISFT